MIFATAGAIQKIISGEKTQTRRIVKEGEELKSDGIGEFLGVMKGKRVKWQVGKTYAIQSGRGKPAIWYNTKSNEIHYNFPMAIKSPITNKKMSQQERVILSKEWAKYYPDVKPLRIRITSIRKEKLIQTKQQDAIAEGYADVPSFIKAFKKINPKASLQSEVWVLDFCVVRIPGM